MLSHFSSGETSLLFRLKYRDPSPKAVSSTGGLAVLQSYADNFLSSVL